MRALAAFLLVFGAACAGTSDTAQIPGARPPSIYAAGTTMEVFIPTDRAIVSDAIRATPEATWAALSLAYEHFGIEVTQRSDADRVLGNPRFLVSRRLSGTPLSRYLECGSGLKGAFADSYRIQMLIRSAVRPGDAGGSRIDTYVEAIGQNPEGTSNTTVVCSSTQRLEREIAEQVRVRTQGR